MSKPKGYVDTEYLRVVGNLVQQFKQRSYALMQIQPGHTVLDVGCGPGTDTISLAGLVGSAGQGVGVDYDPAMIGEADQRAVKAGVSSWVRHKQADAASLPFESDTFDSSRSERLFQHLLNPIQALSEMTRVTKPGGWIVVLDTDFGTLSTDTAEVDIERRLARFKAEGHLHNGYSGRQLYRLFKRQGINDISIEMVPVYLTDYALARQTTVADSLEQEALKAGIVTEDELRRWHADLEKADAEGVFFCSASQMLVAGRKA